MVYMYINNSLENVAKRVIAGVKPVIAIKEHVDKWNRAFDPKLYAAEPSKTGDGMVDAYLAAVAHYESAAIDLPCPLWAIDKSRFLSDPVHFGFGYNSALLLASETPMEFRMRNVFSGVTSIRKPPDKQARHDAVTQAIANSELSGINPSADTRALLARYASGEIDIDDCIQVLKDKYKHLKPD